jgi:hypothetical protein
MQGLKAAHKRETSEGRKPADSWFQAFDWRVSGVSGEEMCVCCLAISIRQRACPSQPPCKQAAAAAQAQSLRRDARKIPTLSTIYAKCIGIVFIGIAGFMLYSPQGNLIQDGVDFDAFPIAGRAEVRAYYVGTALAVAWACLTHDTQRALQSIAIVLGGFAGTRCFGYAIDGADADHGRRNHQHGVFVAEVLGCSVAGLLLLRSGSKKGAKAS